MSESVADRFPAGAIHNGRVQDERGEADEFRACFDHLAAWAKEAKAALDAAHAEIARLAGERDEAREAYEGVKHQWTRSLAQVADLRAQMRIMDGQIPQVSVAMRKLDEARDLLTPVWAAWKPVALPAEGKTAQLPDGTAAPPAVVPFSVDPDEGVWYPPAEAKEPCPECGDTGSVQDDEAPYLGHACPRCQPKGGE